MRLAVCLALTGALQLLPDAAERGLGWLTLLGRQSLVGYIASVELTYGALASPLKGALSFPRDGARDLGDGRADVGDLPRLGAVPGARRRAGGQREPGGAGTPLRRAGS